MRRLILLAAIPLLIALGGCAVNSTSVRSFTDPSFQRGSLGNVAVLPMRNASISPGEANQINRRLSKTLHERNPGVHIKGPAESMTAINDAGLADDWAVFLSNYTTSGIPDGRILKEVAGALGVEAIVQGEILNLYQTDGVYGGNKGLTQLTVRYTLLGADPAILLWQASAEAKKGTTTTLEGAPPVYDVVVMAIDKIIYSLPPLSENSIAPPPPPEPKKETDEWD